MQETRRHILEILRETGQATVDDIVGELCARRGPITAVTVRHHLARLQEDELIATPKQRHRSTPGRPQHIYALTEKAQEHFPNDYRHLASNLVEQLQNQLSPDGVNVIMEGIAEDMAAEAQIQDVPLRDRLDLAVEYLNEHGYEAYWEETADGYLLHTSNCPYHHISNTTDALCSMDLRLVASLLGAVPRRLTRLAEGDPSCAYMIPVQQES